ncbi:hypothetical protein ECZU20_11540 [Escherichia coli]|nr:hypothetical protein ECZU20_11540 [Escherichia coli]
MTTLAIDIGGTKLAAALIGADGQIRDRRELPTPASQTPEALRDALSALVSPLQAHAQRVAIASTGIIRDGSLLALNPHNLGGLLHFPLVKTLEQLTDLPTIAINDAQAAAWAEYQALEGDITEMVFITVSTGVGGGVVSGGKLLTGPEVWRGTSGIRLPIRMVQSAAVDAQVAWRRLLLVAALRRRRKGSWLVRMRKLFSRMPGRAMSRHSN